MSLQIKVEPAAVKSLTEKARLVPNERIDAALKKLEQLENTISSWKGDSRPAFDNLHEELKDALTNTKSLMNAMLTSLDQAVDDFSKMDDEISTRFEQVVDYYTTN